MEPDAMAVRDLGRVAAWLEASLGYARERGRRRLVWLLEAVRTEIELEKALLSLPSGERLRSWRDGAPAAYGAGDQPENTVAESAEADDLRRRKAEEKSRLKLVAWQSFMQEERREIVLRRDGQLAKLLTQALPGEAPGALRRLAQEDRRQAEEGLVALMSNGKVSYKSLDELSEEDMPARIAASRARTTWLKERRDGWLRRGEGYRGEL